MKADAVQINNATAEVLEGRRILVTTSRRGPSSDARQGPCGDGPRLRGPLPCCRRQGRGLVAVRFFDVEGLEGQVPSAGLRADGRESKAGRFAVYHYQGAERSFSDDVARCGVLFTAVSVENEAQAFLKELSVAEIARTMEGGLWTAKVRFRGTELSAGLDVDTGRVAFRKIDGVEQAEGAFVVNGQNWMSKCLEKK